MRGLKAKIFILLLAWTPNCLGNESETRQDDEYDNSIASIVGDGGLDTQPSSSQNGLRNNGNALEYHEILSSSAYRTGTVLPTTARESYASPVTQYSAIRLVNPDRSLEEETTQESTTDGRRVFGFRNPLQEMLELAAKKRAAAGTSQPTIAASDGYGRDVTTPKITTVDVDNASTVPGRNETKQGRSALENRILRILPTPDATASPKTVSPKVSGRIDFRLCGYPPVCDQLICKGLNISEDKLEKCEIEGAKGGFAFVVVLVALFIVVGNFTLPFLVWRNRDMRAAHNFMKVSLAIADVIVGFVLLFSVVPNIVQTMQSTEAELIDFIQASVNTPRAIIAGAMLTLSAQASLFHLTYMSIERFVAIKWPLWHRFKAPGSVSLHVAAIWALSMITALVPAAFPNSFTFQYIPTLYVYIMTASNENYEIVGSVYLAFTMAVPFLLSVVLTVATGVVVWKKMKATSHMRRYSTRNSRWTQRASAEDASNGTSKRRTKSQGDVSIKELKPEVAVFKTTVIMISAFFVTLAPFIVVAILFSAGYYDCTTYSVPYAASFYACMSNSFVNVLIYTARDRKFRSSWKKILRLSKRRRWTTSVWKTQRTRTTDCSSDVRSTQRPGKFTEHREAGKERWEKTIAAN